MSFKLTNEARFDLLSIGRYTQKLWGVKQRVKYLAGINDKFQFLDNNPLLSRLRVEFQPPVRIHHHEKHLIIYLIENNDITILRVLHENMNIEK